MQLTYLRLIEIRSGLAALKEKRLPSLDAELLVASLWYLLKPHFDAIDDVSKKLQRQMADAKDDPDARRALVQEFESWQSSGLVEVPPPKKKLAKDHLPQPYKGEQGEANSTANAGIIIALGPDFFHFDGD